jgi:hypothetical protein
MWAQVMVTHVTSYDIFVGGVTLHPLGVVLHFCILLNKMANEKNCKTLLPIKFVKGHLKNVGTLSKLHALAF